MLHITGSNSSPTPIGRKKGIGRTNGESSRSTTMENYSSTFGSRFRRSGSWEVTGTPATYKDGLISEDFGESSSCNSIVNRSMIAHLISIQLLEHFGGK